MYRVLFFVLIIVGNLANFRSSAALHHACSISIDPTAKTLSVIDTLIFRPSPRDTVQFLLNKDLSVDHAPGMIRYTDIPADESGESSVARLVTLTADNPVSSPLILKYSGEVGDTLHESVDYARGFATTSGIIDTIGVFLSGGTYWLPTFEDSLFTFDLNVDLPPEWKCISQGRIVGSGNPTRWECRQPMEEAYLVAGKYWLSRRSCGDVDSDVYLFEPDSVLASSYHEATCRYIDMYSDLIGDYPYPKFALVENFWQTGYGMPSFTLLGSIVIRLPFIVHTSYGHEILHNWWGNGVYVDWESGNWCEGITAYMADHYYKELQGVDDEHREKLLLHYLWYASEGDDIPLTRFAERHSSDTEAVGYGKSAMVFHMIRRLLGDEIFFASLREFWEDYRFRRASWDDMMQTFERVSGQSFDTFTSQWIRRSGAPAIHLSQVSLSDGDLYISLEQKEPFFDLTVPIVLTYETETSDSIIVHYLIMNEATADTVLTSIGSPSEIQIDPDYDVFRILDPKEAPPGLGCLFARDSVFVRSVLSDSLSTLITEGLPVPCISHPEPLSPRSDPHGAIVNSGYLDLLNWNNVLRELSSDEMKIIDTCGLDVSSLSGPDQTLILASLTERDEPHLSIIVHEDAVESTIQSVIRKLIHYDTYTLLLFSGNRCIEKHRVNPYDNPMSVSLP